MILNFTFKIHDFRVYIIVIILCIPNICLLIHIVIISIITRMWFREYDYHTTIIFFIRYPKILDCVQNNVENLIGYTLSINNYH